MMSLRVDQARHAEAITLYSASLKTAFAHLSEHPDLKSEWAAPLKIIASRAKELKRTSGVDPQSSSQPITPRERPCLRSLQTNIGIVSCLRTLSSHCISCAGTKLECVIKELPNALQTRFTDAVAAERAGETARAATEYQAGVKLSAGFLKDYPEMKSSIAPKLQNIMAHAKQLAVQ